MKDKKGTEVFTFVFVHHSANSKILINKHVSKIIKKIQTILYPVLKFLTGDLTFYCNNNNSKNVLNLLKSPFQTNKNN